MNKRLDETLDPLQRGFSLVPFTSLFVSVAHKQNAGFVEDTPEDLQTYGEALRVEPTRH